LLALVWFVAAPVAAYKCKNPPYMLIVLDQSGSMSGSKWTSAQNAISAMMNSNSNLLFGLMYFAGNCTNAVAVGCGPKTSAAIISSISSTYPSGMTEIGGALSSAGTYFNGLTTKRAKYVVVVTDGCTAYGCGSATAAAATLKAAGIKTFVVGFGSGVCPSQLSAIAAAGGTKSYFQASSPAQLNGALKTIGGIASCCGNGLIDKGEKCDTKIPAGSPGACPASCDDGDPCTKDAFSGILCARVCSNTAITAAASGDGCCPPGASSLTDADCPAVCGNGVLDKGESCDPGITSGPGKCKTAADCDTTDKCAPEQLKGSGCNVACVKPPPPVDSAVKDGCCPDGKTYLDDPDCPPPCDPDRLKDCIDLCKGVECPEGQQCVQGRCLKGGGGNLPPPVSIPVEPDGGVGGEEVAPDEGCAVSDAGPTGRPLAPASLLILLWALVALRRVRR